MTKTIPTRTRTTQEIAAGGRVASFFLPLAALNLAITSDGSTVLSAIPAEKATGPPCAILLVMAAEYTLLRPARTLTEIGDTLQKQPLEDVGKELSQRLVKSLGMSEGGRLRCHLLFVIRVGLACIEEAEKMPPPFRAAFRRPLAKTPRLPPASSCSSAA